MDPLKGSIQDPVKQEASDMELRHGTCMILTWSGKEEKWQQGGMWEVTAVFEVREASILPLSFTICLVRIPLGTLAKA